MVIRSFQAPQVSRLNKHGSRAAQRVPARVRSRLSPGDAFLLNADLVKNPDVLIAAYSDSAGAMAAFDKNILAVLNTRLGANFDLDAFGHVALWVQDTEWVELRLRSAADQLVRVPGADLTVRFAAGEEIRTMISAKFHRDGLTSELAAAGSKYEPGEPAQPPSSRYHCQSRC